MEQKTRIGSLYGEFFLADGAEVRLICSDFLPELEP
jgi:hypothetical protein